MCGGEPPAGVHTVEAATCPLRSSRTVPVVPICVGVLQGLKVFRERPRLHYRLLTLPAAY